LIHYECQQCGAHYPKWSGQCLSCKAWNSLIEAELQKPSKVSISSSKKTLPIALNQVSKGETIIIPTLLSEVDSLLGSGLVMGSVVLMSGEPGIGKSTLSLQLCQNLARSSKRVLYISAEESSVQLRLRAERLGDLPDTLFVFNESNMANIITQLDRLKPDVILLDSIQVVYHPEVSAVQGSVSQLRFCAGILIDWVKSNDKAAIIIGHITKEGNIAGPKVLEHLVDVILYLEGQRQWQYRILRSYKNRYASTDQIALFEMKEAGLIPLSDPSQFFIQAQCFDQPGSVIVPYCEGQRVFLIEIQALVVESGYGMAKRNFVGVDPNRANLLIAALDKLFRLRLAAHDIFVSIIGGLKISDPSIDLAIIVAIVSSLRLQSIKERMGIIGEVGLTGEIRPVTHLKRRLIELKKCGFTHCIIPEKNQSDELDGIGLEILYAGHVKQVLNHLFVNESSHAR
jgi:DNA repair protein RadA/Sms